MRLDSDEDVINIVEYVNAANGQRFARTGIKALPRGNAIETAKDSPGIYFVPGLLAADDAILKFSNEHFPDYIEEESDKSRFARRALSRDLAEVIPDPIFEGRFLGRSYALWPKYRAISGQRIVGAVQKRLLYDNLFRWLRGIAEVSINRNPSASATNLRCRIPLEQFRTNKNLSPFTRSLADRALQQFESGNWRPVNVLQHSDFWLGNILLPRHLQRCPNNNFKFFVIDWAGSLIDGSPGLDLVRLCMSAKVALPRTRTELLNYSRSIQIDYETLVFEVIVGLGRIGLSLNEFPKERYEALCESTVDFLRVVGFK
jgi:hypothetical protein